MGELQIGTHKLVEAEMEMGYDCKTEDIVDEVAESWVTYERECYWEAVLV